jgi:hypothetical protein
MQNHDESMRLALADDPHPSELFNDLPPKRPQLSTHLSRDLSAGTLGRSLRSGIRRLRRGWVNEKHAPEHCVENDRKLSKILDNFGKF